MSDIGRIYTVPPSMTQLRLYAGLAMHALISRPRGLGFESPPHPEDVALDAVTYADELVKQLEVREGLATRVGPGDPRYSGDVGKD